MNIQALLKIRPWWKLVVVIYAVALAAFLILYFSVSDSRSTWQDGPYKVSMKKITMVGQGHLFRSGSHSNNQSHLKCWYPDATAGKALPVIIFFPETSLQSRNFTMLAKRLASHGFFVVLSKTKVNTFWVDLFQGRWRHLAWHTVLSAEDVVEAVHLVDGLNRSDAALKDRLSLGNACVGTRMKMEIPYQNPSAPVQGNISAGNGILMTRLSITGSWQIHYENMAIIPFNRPADDSQSTGEDASLGSKLILLIKTQLSSQRLIPLRMAHLVMDRFSGWSGKSYLNICESIIMYFV